MMDRDKSRLPSTPANPGFAWSRFRRLLRLLMAITIALMLVALRLAVQHGSSTSIRRYVLAASVVGLTMLLASTAMGTWYLVRQVRVAGENPPPAPRRSDVPE